MKLINNMWENNSFTKLMVKHHRRIEDLLVLFKESTGENFELMSESFDKFKWELEKHIFTEEKAIFKFCDCKDENISTILSDLIKEHDVVLEMLNTLLNDLAIKDKFDVSQPERLLKKHKSFEDSFLYPKLDASLDNSQKSFIIKKINEFSADYNKA